MDLSPRAKKILGIMLEKNDAISATFLAKELGISKRTIQREIECFPKYLRKHNLEFASKTGVGIWIIGDEKQKRKLVEAIKSDSAFDDTDKEYRRKRIVYEVLKDKCVKKLFWYSTKFKVSETTISADIESLEPWFKTHDLKIVKKPGSGISVIGSEANYRKAIKAFISENIDTNFIVGLYETNSENSDVIENFQKSGFMDILGEDTVRRVNNCINMIDSTYIKSLTDNSYIALIMHISIAVKRILDKEIIEDKLSVIVPNVEDDEYEIANKIADELCEEFEIEIPKLELSYIYLHMKAAKLEKVSIKADSGEVNIIADKMIYAFDEKMAYRLKQDEDFLFSLLAHLSPTIIRLMNGMNIHNPMLKEVKSQYRDVYNKCKNSAKVLEEYLGKSVPEAEIGFLAVHFAAALVRIESSKQKYKVVSIGIVCSSGIGVSRLMLSKLRKTFKNRVNLTAYGKNEIDSEVIEKEDFLISSVQMNSTEIQVIQVHPLLNEKDMERIRQTIVEYEIYTEEILQKKPLVEFEDISTIAKLISIVEKSVGIHKIDENLSFLEALSVITRSVCKPYENQEKVEKDILEREKISSQIFPEMKFALLHAKTKGIYTPSFTIFTTNDMSDFKSDDFKGINVIFTMLIPLDENEKVYSDIMGSISSSLIEDTELIDNVLADNEVMVRKKIASVLKVYFKKKVM